MLIEIHMGGGFSMAIINYIVKVEDAKMVQIKKALEAANIKVISIIDVYKEGMPQKPQPKKEEKK